MSKAPHHTCKLLSGEDAHIGCRHSSFYVTRLDARKPRPLVCFTVNLGLLDFRRRNADETVGVMCVLAKGLSVRRGGWAWRRRGEGRACWLFTPSLQMMCARVSLLAAPRATDASFS